MSNCYAVILARGGSKGIPRKNLLEINGKPLIQYTIEQCLESDIKDIYTSSDCDEILEIAAKLGSKVIKRPSEFSLDSSTSESAWIDSLKNIKNLDDKNDWIFAPQVTSPIRSFYDINKAIKMAFSDKYDSILSGIEFEDFFLWSQHKDILNSLNYDFKTRKRRQDINEKTYLENGSFYMFKPYGIKKFHNRLYGKIGICTMDKIKMFQIDTPSDKDLIEKIIKISK